MAKDSSFDIVSQVDMQEMSNAVNQTEKEISQRYDFRGSIASIELEDKAIKIAAEDDYKLNAIIDILRARMAKRGLSLRSLELGKIEDAAKGSVRQMLTIKQGISKENAKKIIAAIKATNDPDVIVPSRIKLTPKYKTPATPNALIKFKTGVSSR